LDADRYQPVPGEGEALVQILRAGICSTDLEIIKGYVPGFDSALGHEFVGRVAECPGQPDLVGQRVVGEINCNCDRDYQHEDPIFARNHAPNRVVLGIIAKDGCMAEYVTLPVENLHRVPDNLSDKEACFVEPLAAANRILEQKAIERGAKVAVIGDGKFGLLIAQSLAVSGMPGSLTHFGRHSDKMALVTGDITRHIVDDDTKSNFAMAFDVCIEASGTAAGVLLAVGMTRSMGTVVLKTTCSTQVDKKPAWAEVANDIVVQELRLVGSRCGPFPAALEQLQDPRMRSLVNAMVDRVFPLSEGLEAIKRAQTKGVIKIQIEAAAS